MDPCTLYVSLTFSIVYGNEEEKDPKKGMRGRERQKKKERKRAKIIYGCENPLVYTTAAYESTISTLISPLLHQSSSVFLSLSLVCIMLLVKPQTSILNKNTNPSLAKRTPSKPWQYLMYGERYRLQCYIL